jgi:hypothetical protein
MTALFFDIMNTLASVRETALPLALTPWERWSAAAKFNSGSNAGAGQSITIIGVTILIVLLALLVKTSFNRRQKNRQLAAQQFLESIRRRNLSVREYHILLDIISLSGLRRKEAIFDNDKAFELGASRILAKQTNEQGPESAERLLAELEFLREKLGFKRHEGLDKTPIKQKKGARKLTTRDIPLGKSLRITRRLGRNANEITTTVVANDEDNLTATLDLPIKVTFGEMWRAHCFFGASAWEFDTSVVSFEGDKIVLKHSNDVRFINRRRFMRTPVSCPAHICCLPFSQIQKGGLLDTGGNQGQPIEWVEGYVTELAGSGLLLETQLNVDLGARVLIVFRLVDQRDPQHAKGLVPVTRIIQDIGIVRRIDTTRGGFALGIELVGMTDANVDELLRVSKLISFNEKAEKVLEDALVGSTGKESI